MSKGPNDHAYEDPYGLNDDDNNDGSDGQQSDRDSEQARQDREERKVVSVYQSLKAYTSAAYVHGCLLRGCDLGVFIDFARWGQCPSTRRDKTREFFNFVRDHGEHLSWMYRRCGGKEVSQLEEDFVAFVFAVSGPCTMFCRAGNDPGRKNSFCLQ